MLGDCRGARLAQRFFLAPHLIAFKDNYYQQPLSYSLTSRYSARSLLNVESEFKKSGSFTISQTGFSVCGAHGTDMAHFFPARAKPSYRLKNTV